MSPGQFLTIECNLKLSNYFGNESGLQTSTGAIEIQEVYYFLYFYDQCYLSRYFLLNLPDKKYLGK
jgi:hypothetical protein